jgi:hypothetical protein
MSLEDEVNKLNADITVIDTCLKFFEVVQSGNTAWCEINFDSVLSCCIKGSRIAKQYSVGTSPIEYEGLTKIDILQRQVQNVGPMNNLRDMLSKKVGILDAELRVKFVFAQQIDEFDDESNFLVLRPNDRAVVTQLIAEIRLEVTNADWIDDKHRVRVLARISGVEAEILQPLSSYQRALGGLTVLGDAIGEFGNLSKPTFDRVVELIDSIKGAKKESAQISKDKDPLQIPDLRSNGAEL